MSEVIVYSTQSCPYCVRAKQFLDAKGVAFKEIRVDQDPTKFEEMLAVSGGRRSVPQIVINGQAIGGYDDMVKLDQHHQLDALLKSE